MAVWLAVPVGFSGMAVAAGAVLDDASAHTGDLNVTVTCNQQTGQYDETATLTLSQVPSGETGSTMWRVGSSSFEGTPTSASGMDKGPVSSDGNVTITLGTWSLPGDTTGYGPWVYAYTKWSPDNYAKGSDGQSTTQLNGDCTGPTPTPGTATATTTCSNPSGATGTLVLTITNTADDTKADVTYDATLNNGAPKHLTLSDGASGTVTFTGIPVSVANWLVTGPDGTNSGGIIEVEACHVTPPPPPHHTVVKHPHASINCGCHAKATVRLNNNGSNVAVIYRVVGTKANGAHVVRLVRVAAHHTRVIRLTSLKHHSGVRVRALGKLLAHLTVPGRCYTPPHTLPPTGK